MNILVLNSNNARDNIHYLDEAIVGKYKLLSFVFTNNLHNVNDYNNKIYLNENGTNRVVTLTNGYYDTTDFVTHLATQLNLTLAGTVGVSLNNNTNKLTITNTLNYYFTFGTNTDNSARKLLGFNASDGSSTTSHTSDIAIDLNTCKNVFINILENDSKNVNGVNYFNTSLVINGLGNFGELVRYIDKDNFDQYIHIKNTKSLKITTHDINENNIDLNSDYTIIFKKC